MKIPKAAKVNKKTGDITHTIDVTAHDIRYGRQSSASTCAIAQALKREFKERDVNVEAVVIKVDGYKMYHVGKKIRTFISKFDEDKKLVKPFSFIIKLKKAIW